MSALEHAMITREGALARPLSGGGTSGTRRSHAWRVRRCDRMCAAASQEAVHAPESSLRRRRTRQRVRPSRAAPATKRRAVLVHVAGVGPIPVQRPGWQRWAQSRCGGGSGDSGPNPGADVARIKNWERDAESTMITHIQRRLSVNSGLKVLSASSGIMVGWLGLRSTSPMRLGRAGQITPNVELEAPPPSEGTTKRSIPTGLGCAVV